MKLGLKPIKFKDHRTLSFHRTFGTVTAIPDEFNLDVSGIFPDQEVQNMPNGCSAFTVNDIASNEDQGGYYNDQRFTYENTKKLEGVSGEVPVGQMDSLKAGTVYGVKDQTQTPEEALKHRRAPYFLVEPLFDHYQGCLSAMWLKKGALSMGTPWLPEFEQTGSDGIVPDFFTPQDFTVGHNWAAVGQKVVNGEPRIICKSWQGPNFGDRGYCYFSRRQINSLLAVEGAGAFGQAHASPQDLQRVQMTILETILSFIQIWLRKLRPVVPVTTQASPVVSVKRDLLTEFCQAITDYEGSPGDRNYRNNNPGNCRLSPIGYAPIYGKVGHDAQGFAIFKDYATGFLYLKNLIKGKATIHPQYTIGQCMAWYAPTGDGNNPVTYATFIAKRLGVDSSFMIGQLLK